MAFNHSVFPVIIAFPSVFSTEKGSKGIFWKMKENLHTTPTIKIGREVFAASSSRFTVFGFGRKDAGVKALFS
jgi:hypothetical protein